MDDSFQVLEQKVRKAADLVTRLRKQNDELERVVADLRPKLERAEQRLALLEKEKGGAADDVRKAEALTRELKSLREEREEVRRRIGRLVEVLDGLE